VIGKMKAMNELYRGEMMEAEEEGERLLLKFVLAG